MSQYETNKSEAVCSSGHSKPVYALFKETPEMFERKSADEKDELPKPKINQSWFLGHIQHLMFRCLPHVLHLKLCQRLEKTVIKEVLDIAMDDIGRPVLGESYGNKY